MQTYIWNLEDSNGKQIVRARVKTGFVGFYINLEAAELLADDLLRNERPLKYVLFYKLSQDHLEIFFGAVRNRNGNNVNPTCHQFERAMKGLALHAEMKIANANVEDTSVPLLCSTFKKKGIILTS